MASRARVKVNQSKPKSTRRRKKVGSYVPYAQQVRMVAKSAAGKSIRQIAKEEGRNRVTVSKIVKSEDMIAEAQKLREVLFGEVGDAVVVRLKHTISDLTSKQGDWIAVEIGEQLGILPGKVRKLQLNGNNNGQGTTTPKTTEEERVATIVARLTATAMDRGQHFGMPMPEVEDLDKDITIELEKK